MAGEVVTAAILNIDHRDNLGVVWHEVAGVQGGADATATTSVLDLIDAPTATFAASVTRATWSIGGIASTGASEVDVYLFDGAANLATIGHVGAGTSGCALSGGYRFTPSAGSKSYSLRIQLGAGSAATYAPYSLILDQKG